MDGIEIRTISEKDVDKYSKGKGSRILMDVEAPSSPPLRVKDIQIVSGKRKGFQAKNDGEKEKQTEKKISGRMPRFEDGELKPDVLTLEPVKSNNDSKTPAANGTSTIPAFEPGKTIVLDLSPEMPKKTPAPKSSRRTDVDGRHLLKSRSRTRLEEMEELASDKKSKVEEPPRSPPANRRGENSRSQPRASKNMHYENRSTLKSADLGITLKKDDVEVIGGKDISRHSSRRSKSSRPKTKPARPQSPHRVHRDNHPGISIGGQYMTSGDLNSRSTGSDSARESDQSSRRKLTETASAFEKKLSEHYDENDFDPEDEAHLRQAIKTALSLNQEATVKEALENGYELNAEILKSLHRPEAMSEAIEALVSDRRERIREREKQTKIKSKSKIETKVERGDRKLKAAAQKVKSKPVIDSDAEDDSDDEIVIKESSESKKPKVKLTMSDSSPVKTTLPGTSINVGMEEVSVPVSATTSKPKTPPKSKKKESKRKEIPEEEDSEENVKLPKATRAATRDEIEQRKGEFGASDNLTYDPLGVGDEVGDNDSIDGDNEFEESAEDENRLTIGEKKDDMLYRFRLVRQEYPGIALPRITKKMKLAKMVRLYEHVQSRIKLKVKTRNFKIFLIGGFLILQFAGKKFGLDTSGFTVNQMNSMQMYEKYLRELGTSDWTSIGVDFPVTVRLPFFMLVNAGIFIISKMFFKKTGKDYSVQFYKLYAQLTGGDDYAYIRNEAGGVGMDAGEGAGDGGDGIFGLLKSFLGMMGGGDGGGDAKPKRGEAKGPTYKKKTKGTK